MPNSILLITGPTGAGKTQLAAKRARELGACLVPMDQLQLYRHLEVGVGFDRSAISGLRSLGYQSLDPWEPFRPQAYVSWLLEHLKKLSQQSPVVIEGGCTSYLRELVLSRSTHPLLRAIKILVLAPESDLRQRELASLAHYSIEHTQRIVDETAMLRDLGYWSEAGLDLFRLCEGIFVHPENPNLGLAWALRISARIYYPAAQVLLGRLSLAEARARIVANVEDIRTYQRQRIRNLQQLYPNDFASASGDVHG